MKGYYLDAHPDANVANEHFAVLTLPRRKRSRCPESSVDLKESKEQAIADANIGAKRYPAKVIGPARSSEGFNVYYIIEIFE